MATGWWRGLPRLNWVMRRARAGARAGDGKANRGRPGNENPAGGKSAGENPAGDECAVRLAWQDCGVRAF